MKHEHSIDGRAFALRPVRLDDAEFIVELRTGDPERTRYLHPISSDPQAQREWIHHYFERPNDCYWIIERRGTGEREGTIGLYDVDPVARTAEWGRWVLRAGSLAAAESAWLIYRAAFEVLALAAVYCLTVAGNLPVLSFHDSCGLLRETVLPDHFSLGDRRYDAVKHLCPAERWPSVRDRLTPQVEMIARRLERKKAC